MTDYSPEDILNFSINQQPLKVGDAFDALMRDKISDKLPDFQDELSQTMFSNDEDEDFDIDEDDFDEDELDFDDDDDIDEDDLEDLDLEDIDIEDITDEDS